MMRWSYESATYIIGRISTLPFDRHRPVLRLVQPEDADLRDS